MSSKASIYKDFLDNVVLDEAHKQDLQTKRSFSEDIIERCGFKTGNGKTGEAVSCLLSKYSQEDLVSAGILRDPFESEKPTHGDKVVSRQLTENRILIPYINREGDVTHLRAHKAWRFTASTSSMRATQISS